MVTNVMFDSSARVGPFVGVTHDRRVIYGDREFRIIAYCAYNAGGLIGPEMNGVAILDEDNKVVVVDELCKEPTGYHGTTQNQIKFWDKVCSMSWTEFKDLCNNSGRSRINI